MAKATKAAPKKAAAKTAKTPKTRLAPAKRNRQSKNFSTKKGTGNVNISRQLLATVYQSANTAGKKALENAYPNLVGSTDTFRLGSVVEVKVGRFTYKMLISLAKNRKGSKWITLTNIDNGTRWNNSVCVRNVKAITRLEMMNLVGSQNIGGVTKIADKVSL